jgi:hypothetical protein
MSTESRIVVAVALVSLLVWLLLLVRRRQMRGKYVLFWFGAIVVLVILVAWPDAAAALVGGEGEQSAFDGFVLVAVGFSILALVHVAWELSRLEERSRILAEEDALLGGTRESDEREPGALAPKAARSDEETG